MARLTHQEIMHNSFGSNATAMPSNWVMAADGVGNVVWSPMSSGGSASFGSNATDVSSTSAVGGSANSAREDHVHRGIRTITANTSNSKFGDYNIQQGSGIALGVSGQTLTISSTGAGGGGGGSGGGLAQSYIGYNTVGGNTQAGPTGGATIFVKKITTSTTSIVMGIEAYVDMHSAAGTAFFGGIYNDSSGPTTLVTAIGQNGTGAGVYLVGATDVGHWLGIALPGFSLAAGTYWLGIGFEFQGTLWRIYYDTSGSDGAITVPASSYVSEVNGGGGGTYVADTKKYSIRASILS